MADWADFAGCETFTAGLKASWCTTFGNRDLSDNNDHRPKADRKSRIFQLSSCEFLQRLHSDRINRAASRPSMPDQLQEAERPRRMPRTPSPGPAAEMIVEGPFLTTAERTRIHPRT